MAEIVETFILGLVMMVKAGEIIILGGVAVLAVMFVFVMIDEQRAWRSAKRRTMRPTEDQKKLTESVIKSHHNDKHQDTLQEGR